MPVYPYRCKACGDGVEIDVPISARNEAPPCPSCAKVMSRDWGYYPYTALKWHFGQGIGDKLSIPAAQSRSVHGDSSKSP